MSHIRKVDHVAIAVWSIAETIPLFRDALGGSFISGGDNDETGIRLLHLQLPAFKLELLQPVREDSLIHKHLETRGPGFHHLTFFVDDLPSTIRDLDAAGFSLTDSDLTSPAWRETFISPRSGFGTLLQFVETDRSWDEPATDITLDDVLAGQVVWQDYVSCLRADVKKVSDGATG